MTATTTQREIRSPHNGRVPEVDSPAVRARARASIEVTDSEINGRGRISAIASSWWVWTAQPLSLQEMWRLSAVDPKRIPNDAGLLRLAWKASNGTDRLLMFLLVLLVPTALTGPVRWLTCRPTRRYGLYLVTVLLVVALLIGRSTS